MTADHFVGEGSYHPGQPKRYFSLRQTALNIDGGVGGEQRPPLNDNPLNEKPVLPRRDEEGYIPRLVRSSIFDPPRCFRSENLHSAEREAACLRFVPW